MTLRERTTRTGLEITLECKRARLVGEFDQNINLPWTSIGGVLALARVMCLEAKSSITGDASVVSRSIGQAPKQVDAALGNIHADSDCNRTSVQKCLGMLLRARRIRSSPNPPRDVSVQILRPVIGMPVHFRGYAATVDNLHMKGGLPTVHLRPSGYGGQPSRGLPTVAHAPLTSVSEGWWIRFVPDGTACSLGSNWL